MHSAASAEALHSAPPMHHLLMSIDPSNGAQELFSRMSKGVVAGGSASPSSLASSGAPSSSSVVNDGDDKEAAGNPWLNMIMQQSRTPGMNDFLEQLGLSQPSSAQLLEGMAQANPALASLMSANSLVQAEVENEEPSALVRRLISSVTNDGTGSELNSPTAATPQSLASFLLPPSTPSTSTATSDGPASTQASVIVSSAQEPSTPPAKKSRSSDEADPSVMKAAFDNLLLAQMSSSMGPSEQMTCDECGKECANLFALFSHKARDHSSADSVNEESGQMKCGECDKEFENAAYLEQHRNTHHGNLMAQRLLGGLFPNSLGPVPFMLPSPLHPQFGMPDLDSSLSALSTPKQGGAVKRQYSSNGKNYCDLCNKEVCNKYFLRTHMLKMHGIVIDENKTVIANIDTLERERQGNLSFRCDTCLNEFKSRSQLRQHKQDAHGVVPLSTPSNRGPSGKSSMPTTPLLNGASLPNLIEEKCGICDKRIPAIMMPMHLQQEHMVGQLGQQLTPDISQVMALLNQASRTSRDSDEGRDMLRCNRCQYMTRDARNMEMHQERHDPMNEAKRRSSDEDEDDALKMTTEAALKMVVANHLDGDDSKLFDTSAAVLNLSVQKPTSEIVVVKKDDDEKPHERNSHTSGSISPSGDSLPEGFGKALGNEKYAVQTFVIRSNDEKGAFLGEFVAHLPVRSIIDSPRQVVFELHPTSAPAV